MITKSRLKTEYGGFNNCPSRALIDRFIADTGAKVKFVDADKEYYQNENDTMVFSPAERTIENGLKIAAMIHRLGPDVVNVLKNGTHLIVRLWWD
jgi:hypothetical protein